MQWYYTLTFLVLILACKNEKKENTSLVSSRNLIHDTISELFILDTAQSIVYWQGSNWKNTHNGSIKIKEGKFFLKNDSIISASVLIDMNTIKNLDLSDEKERQELIEELKSQLFFDTENFQYITLDIKDKHFIVDSNRVETRQALLTMKGITKPISISYRKGYSKDAMLITISALRLNRKYWSNPSTGIIEMIADKVVEDTITLHAKILLEKK